MDKKTGKRSLKDTLKTKKKDVESSIKIDDFEKLLKKTVSSPPFAPKKPDSTKG